MAMPLEATYFLRLSSSLRGFLHFTIMDALDTRQAETKSDIFSLFPMPECRSLHDVGAVNTPHCNLACAGEHLNRPPDGNIRSAHKPKLPNRATQAAEAWVSDTLSDRRVFTTSTSRWHFGM